MSNEMQICYKIIEMLSKEFDKKQFGIEQRSTNYVSLIYRDNDILRVKFTERSKWISIRLANQDRNNDDIRFMAQTNKGQLHWKANIENEDDIYSFEKEFINSCKEMGEGEYVPRDINHSSITISIEDLYNKKG